MTLKRTTLAIFTLSLLMACAKETPVELVKVSDTGCAREEAVTKGGDETPSQIILEYSTEGLVVIRTNAVMNCSVKTGGISCNVSVSGNTIHCEEFEKDGKSMRCTCPVSNITSTIKGLGLGKEYTLCLTCDGSFAPIGFTYTKDLKMVLDAELYRL